MEMKYGTQSVRPIPGRNIILSSCDGKTNIDELKWLTNTVLASAAPWNDIGWAYIADCSRMSPVSPAESSELVSMTRKFAEAGCKAFGFAEGDSVFLRIQAQKNTACSQINLPEGHFETVDEALAWIKKDIHI